MTNTPIIDSIIKHLEDKGISVDNKHDIFKNDNKQQYNNSNKNKLRKSKRNLIRRWLYV